MQKKQEMKELKKLLQESSDLSKIADSFLKNFPESGNWDNSGKTVEKPLLEKTIVQAVSMKFTVGKEYIFIAVKDKVNKLIHGILNFGHYSGMFFYVPAVAKGLVAVHNLSSATQMDYFRFSLSNGVDKYDDIKLSDIEEVPLNNISEATH